jgi:hypothetical protein
MDFHKTSVDNIFFVHMLFFQMGAQTLLTHDYISIGMIHRCIAARGLASNPDYCQIEF